MLAISKSDLQETLKTTVPVQIKGLVTEVAGLSVKALINGASIGEMVLISQKNKRDYVGQIVGFKKDTCQISLYGDALGLAPGAIVTSTGNPPQIQIGPGLIGKCINWLGETIAIHSDETAGSWANDRQEVQFTNLYSKPPKISERLSITKQFHTGINAIDYFLTVGQGQRLCILAEPGVGKSTLINMISSNSSADINIIALIGERGREATEFIDSLQTSGALKKSIVIVSTSDEPAICRINAVQTAVKIALYFANSGKNTLLQVDSLTRLFRAYREVGLAAGEMPVRRGYTPSVYAHLPELIEKAGQFQSGSITAFYTALLSEDIDQDPMIEEVKGLTDGHIFLSKKLAEQNYFPAIDLTKSLSRLEKRLKNQEHYYLSKRVKGLLSLLEDKRDFLLLGGRVDEELRLAMAVESWLKKTLVQNDSVENSFSEELYTELSELLRNQIN